MPTPLSTDIVELAVAVLLRHPLGRLTVISTNADVGDVVVAVMGGFGVGAWDVEAGWLGAELCDGVHDVWGFGGADVAVACCCCGCGEDGDDAEKRRSYEGLHIDEQVVLS